MTPNSAHENSSTQFSHPRLVAVFDTLNPVDGYKDFYLDLAGELSPTSIIDVGCGTGLLTCELARQGYQVIGVEPSGPLLELARKRSGCDNVKWIQGHVGRLGDAGGDLAIMTGHVAQFFLDDESWNAALSVISKALTPGGHLAFESRNPLIPPFADWPTAESRARLHDPLAGDIEWWSEVLEVKSSKVRYELHYLFVSSGEEVVSTDELVFRSRDEIVQSLRDAEFSVQSIYGDWDRSLFKTTSPEMIFVARKN